MASFDLNNGNTLVAYCFKLKRKFDLKPALSMAIVMMLVSIGTLRSEDSYTLILI